MISARRAAAVPVPPTFQSQRVIHSPRWRCTHPADFTITVYHPLAVPTVCAPSRRSGCCVVSARGLCSRPADCPVSTYHPVIVLTVCFPRHLSGRWVPSARRAGGVHSTPTFTSQHTIRSRRHLCAYRAAAYHPLAPPSVCLARQLSGRCEQSVRRASSGLPAASTLRSR
jgi:hypothetical protein